MLGGKSEAAPSLAAPTVLSTATWVVSLSNFDAQRADAYGV